jgi:hypothetical protein
MSAIRTTRVTRSTRLALATVLMLLALGAAAPVSAGEVRHVRIEIQDAFVDGFLTEACGTEVVVSVDASLNVTLRSNQQGLIVQEIDPAGGGTITTIAPDTGNSFSFSFNSTIIDYGSGAEVGSTFTRKFVGLIGHVPGFISSDAGQAVVTGTVVGFDEFGIPILHTTDLVTFHGHSNSGEDVIEAMCEALNA